MAALSPDPGFRDSPRPILGHRRSVSGQVVLGVFVLLPTCALAAAIALVWGWGLSWIDVALSCGFYLLGGLGVTAGFHRCFTHRSFAPTRALRIALAIAGSLAVQGPLIAWVADHRRHHAFTDKDGDPHSPWRYGTSGTALVKGFWHAHIGWMFHRDQTNPARFAPDLLADPDVVRVDRHFGSWTILSLAAPAVLGGILSWSWLGALTALFWAGPVRIAVLHHVTWSVNSICHTIGERPFTVRDHSTNFWPLALLSFGESWHNLHHADPTCARHGVRAGQLDMTARLIWAFEKLGWASDVRWPTHRRLERLTADR